MIERFRGWARRWLYQAPPRDPALATFAAEQRTLAEEGRTLAAEQRTLAARVASLERQLDSLRSSLELDPLLPEAFQEARQTPAYQAVFDQHEPLVSVCIGTYNRARLLVERALPSVLSQDYPRLEVVVVGDGCSDDTAARVAAVADPRVSFVNLPARGVYPGEASWRWMVAGTVPFNHALSLARGDFITHLDDDDEYLPGRLTKLVRHAQAHRAEVVWHPFEWEFRPGEWILRAAEEFAYTQVTTSSVFYHRWLARIPWSVSAWRTGEPGDWHRFRKFIYLGVNLARFPEPLLRHHQERAQ